MELQSTGGASHPVLKKLFESRQLTPQNVHDLLSWDLKALPVLTELKDLQKASDRVIKALEGKEKLGVYGDYDVDGTTSCALLTHFFRWLGVEIERFQPSRFIEGYGVHPSSIDEAMEREIDVLITVDCGITSLAAADYASQKELDLIITDHHTDGAEEMPQAYAVINPSRRDEEKNNPLRPLAGVGVAFCLALQIKQDLEKKGQTVPSLYPLLPFVAVGTLCDLVPLSPMNLKLARHGLKQLAKTEFPGLKVFLKNKDLVNTEFVTFKIGPMINSKGRMEHPEVALKLLLADNEAEALECYFQLENSNFERKKVQKEVFKEAKAQILRELKDSSLTSCVCFSPNWHEGVIGIVASKLVETFKVPAIVMTKSGDLIKGSARSAGDLDLYQELSKLNHLFKKFGGHKKAAGLSMEPGNLQTFNQDLNNNLKQIPELLRTVRSDFELKINFNDIDPTLLEQLETLEPYGPWNPRPVFFSDDFSLQSFDILKDEHVRWKFQSRSRQGQVLKGMTFFYFQKWDTPSPQEVYERQFKERLGVRFTLSFNHWKGNKFLQLQVLDFQFGL